MGAKGGFVFIAFLAVFLIASLAFSSAAPKDYVCGVYFTGIGCPHCAKAKPIIDDVLNKTPNLVLIRYEVYETRSNGAILENYASTYGAQPGIPLIIFGKGNVLSGDGTIIDNLESKVKSMQSNPCPLIDGRSIPFSECDVSSLPGKTEIFIGNSNISSNQSCVNPLPPVRSELTFTKIVFLAAVDAINPCAFAVLILILVNILTHNPKKKNRVLMSGLAFALAVFLMYFVYGLVIVKFFQIIQALASLRFYIIKIVAVIAILLGLLNIRDFFNYFPGRFATEMPIMFRPKVRKIISKVTSPLGSFLTGAAVTTFLLPCTVGPYIVAGGILSALDFINTLPWLALYNFIFALPMVIITFVIWGGLSSVENVSGWKDKNIKYIHLTAGLIMLVVGFLMLFGLL